MRTFVGINALGTKIEQVVTDLRSRASKLQIPSWQVPSSPIHLTLIPPFEVNQAQMSTTVIAIARSAAEVLRGEVKLHCKGVEVLEHHSGAYLVIRVCDKDELLERLRDKVAQALILSGIQHPLLQKDWVPHITVGQASHQEKDRLQNVFANLTPFIFSVSQKNVFLPHKTNVWEW